jgi:hypothetical protein
LDQSFVVRGFLAKQSEGLAQGPSANGVHDGMKAGETQMAGMQGSEGTDFSLSSRKLLKLAVCARELEDNGGEM